MAVKITFVFLFACTLVLLYLTAAYHFVDLMTTYVHEDNSPREPFRNRAERSMYI